MSTLRETLVARQMQILEIPNPCTRDIKFNTLAELRAGELGYGVLDVESRFSVEENAACSCFRRVGRLEALQLGFKPTSKSRRRNRQMTSTQEQENIAYWR